MELPTATSADSTATFRIYRNSGPVVVDHLRLSNDTLLALQVRPHPNAAQVPIAIAVAEVDSVKQAYPDRDGFLLFLTPVAVVGGLLLWLSSMSFD